MTIRPTYIQQRSDISFLSIQLERTNERRRHSIHNKEHDVKMKSDDEEIAKNDSRVVNLIAKWLQLFILQMDSSEWVARRMQSHKKGTLEAFSFLVASPQTLITNTITV